MIKVSVCMITYNHEKFIREAIEGVLMQQCDYAVEVIVANDCSTDTTDSIIEEILKNHPHASWIKYINHKENIGAMSNFVDTLQQCQGKYIALCEGDDYWTDPLKLQKQVDFLEANNKYSVCFHPCKILRVINNNIEITNQSLLDIKYIYSFQNLLKYWNIPTASIIFKNDSLINNLPNWFCEVASGDIALIMLFFEKGKFKLLEDVMSVYRIDNGLSKSHINYRMIHYRAVLYSHLNEFFNYKYEKEIFDALNFIYIKFSGIQSKSIPKKTLSSKIKNKIFKIIKRVFNY